MIREAEEFAEEDKLIKERVDARNSLETYAYNMKSQIGDSDKLADKIEEDDKETIEEALREALDWLDDNQEADKEDYEDRLKELENTCQPIISKVYAASGGGGEDDEDLDLD